MQMYFNRGPLFHPPDWLADAIERLWDKLQVRQQMIWSSYLMLGFCALVGYFCAAVCCWFGCGYELTWMVLILVLLSTRQQSQRLR